MDLYLYQIGETVPLLKLENVASYTANRVETADGTVYEPLAENCELSATVDCVETLRADWKRNYPSAESRIEELEFLLAELLFGGEAE